MVPVGDVFRGTARHRQVVPEFDRAACPGNLRIGIIAVPAENAQAICNLLIESGILAIWNFAPVHLDVPEGILVHNENLAASLALLSKQLKEKFDANT